MSSKLESRLERQRERERKSERDRVGGGVYLDERATTQAKVDAKSCLRLHLAREKNSCTPAAQRNCPLIRIANPANQSASFVILSYPFGDGFLLFPPQPTSESATRHRAYLRSTFTPQSTHSRTHSLTLLLTLLQGLPVAREVNGHCRRSR